VHAKLYAKHIDEMRMPPNYQPLKFQQFEGKGNLNQHIIHLLRLVTMYKYVETWWWSILSVKRVIFDWYTKILVGKLDS
jgi:hypothetical protein